MHSIVYSAAAQQILNILSLAAHHRFCAYIDPGTGSFIIQIVIAGLVGSSFAIKIFWSRIKTFFKNIFGKKGKTP